MTTRKTNSMDQLETAFDKVEEIKAELVPAEVHLETRRERVQKMLGMGGFGGVSVGPLSFSKPIIVAGVAIAGLFIGMALLTPGVGIAIAVGIGVAGWAWLKGMFGR